MTDLALVHTFGQSYPEEFDGNLDSVSAALTCSFNRTGSLLAVGCNDGRLVIWDFLTRGIAKILTAHVHPVTSVSWSRNGRKILTASTDWMVGLWDVLSGECDHRYRFPSAIHKVQCHPHNNGKFLVCPMRHPPVLVEVDGAQHILPVGAECEQNIVAAFDRKGEYIFTGNAKGKVCIINTETLEVKSTFRISTGTNSGSAIKSIEFAKRGSSFMINSQDRVIRVFDREAVLACGEGTEPEPYQKLQDLVNRTLWKKCAFSGDGEYIVAGSSRSHALYIWERSVGSLVKILHGTKGELLVDVVWHPVRSIICSIGSGLVSIWAQTHVENWSAFAPDFKELDENVEYEERESEFDIEDEDKEELLNDKDDQLSDDEIDVVSVARPAYLDSDDDESGEDCLYYLPVAPEIDDPEGEAVPGYPQPPVNEANNAKPLSDTTNQISTSTEESAEEGPPRKKTKITDVSIHGEIFDENNLLAEKAQEKSRKRRDWSTKSKRGGRKGSGGSKAGKEASASAAATTIPKIVEEDETSQDVFDASVKVT